MTAGDQIAVVVKGWPRLSETFVAQELVGLERRGLTLALFSLRHPTDAEVHPLNRALAAPVDYLPEYLHHEPVRVLRALVRALGLRGFFPALGLWLRDLARDFGRSRIRRFGQAAVLAAGLPAGTRLIYAHFLHTPASVARYAAVMRGLPWAVSCHAKDIWTLPDWEKREKLAAAAWAVTCTTEGRDHLAEFGSGAVHLLHHGLDFGRFPAADVARPPRDGRDPADPVRLLSVGRAVEKKGFDRMLEALAVLPPDLAWRWTHIGGGPLLAGLQAEARRLGLADRIDWRGPQAQQAVIAAGLESDLLVLPSRPAADGDREGMPNVLMEAQALGVPVLASALPGVAELVLPGRTGILVPADHIGALSRALAVLITHPDQRAVLGRAGHVRVRDRFSCDPPLDRLAALLRGN